MSFLLFVIQGDFNVIIVEWGDYVNEIQAATDTQVVGAQMALLCRTILTAHGMLREHVYCVGHSLGAHICHFASLLYRFPRITGIQIFIYLFIPVLKRGAIKFGCDA